MDIGSGALIGIAYKWLFNWLKGKLNWADRGAAWAFLAGGLLLALVYNVFSGGFAGLSFDPANVSQALQSIGAAWAVIAGTAQAWFAVTKKRS